MSAQLKAIISLSKSLPEGEQKQLVEELTGGWGNVPHKPLTNRQKTKQYLRQIIG